jgi:single-stranded-DNA-specific exonuclease
MRSKRWNILPNDQAAAVELARELNTSVVTAQILLNRGLQVAQACRSFLNPQLRDLVDPQLIPGLTKAADRIAKAIRDQHKIVIYGDYDVDGITATTILWHAIKLLGGDAHYYIPHRVDEGYGLNSEAIALLCDQGAQLIITVDCGVTAVEPARVAKDRGVDMIITDHHEWRDQLPDAFAIVHPRLPHESLVYPNPHLCGAGVAFKLAWGVGQAMGSAGKVPEAMKWFLVDATALAALGTIADVVPLVGENRILARFGLGGLKQTRLNGLKALIAGAQLDGQDIDSFHVGFLLGPRLNACGRMGHAKLAVEMLTDASEARAAEIAAYLEAQNRQRQSVERGIVDEAITLATELGDTHADSRAIVLAKKGWHQGVIGIVASRLVDKFNKPTVIIALDEDGSGHGSARSISGFHLAKAFNACGHLLERHGGHEMAAGLAIAPGKFDDFRAAFHAHAKSSIQAEQLVPTLNVDCVMTLDQVSQALVSEMDRLGPFGNGNPRPMLACRDLTLTAAPKVVGKNREHLQLFVRQGDHYMKAIAFNAAAMLDKLSPGKPVSLAVQPQLNEYMGRVSVELEVKDIQITEAV